MLKRAYKVFKYLHDGIPYRILNGHAFLPLKIIIEVTYKCNLSCRMCYLIEERKNKELKEKVTEMTTKEIKNIIDQVGKKLPIITYTGGEPLIRKDIIEIIKYTKKKNICGLLTNGILLTEDISKKLVDTKIDSITISLDGPEKIHDTIRNHKGAFTKTIHGIMNIQKYKKGLETNIPKVHLVTVMMPSNIKHLHKIVEIASKLNVDSLTFQALEVCFERSGLNMNDNLNLYAKNCINNIQKIDPKLIDKEITKSEKKAKKMNVNLRYIPFRKKDMIDYYSGGVSIEKYICKLPWSLMYISPYGDVYPCFNYKIGNIKYDRINDIWNNKKYHKFRKILKRKKIFPSCIGCCNITYRN